MNWLSKYLHGRLRGIHSPHSVPFSCTDQGTQTKGRMAEIPIAAAPRRRSKGWWPPMLHTVWTLNKLAKTLEGQAYISEVSSGTPTRASFVLVITIQACPLSLRSGSDDGRWLWVSYPGTSTGKGVLRTSLQHHLLQLLLLWREAQKYRLNFLDKVFWDIWKALQSSVTNNINSILRLFKQKINHRHRNGQIASFVIIRTCSERGCFRGMAQSAQQQVGASVLVRSGTDCQQGEVPCGGSWIIPTRQW